MCIVGPRAAATATPAVVVTNSRRSMLIRLVMEMPSVVGEAWSGRCRVRRCRVRRCRVRRCWRPRSTPDPTTPHPTTLIRQRLTRPLSERVQHAEGDLVGVRRAGVVPDHGAVVLEAERVPSGAETQQRVSLMALLAGETTDHRRMVLCELARVGLVEAVVGPEAPVRREIVAGLSPGAPTADVPSRRSCLRDVGEQLSQRLPVVHVPVQGELAGVDAATALDSPRRQIGVFGTRARRVAAGAGGVLPVDMADHVGAPAQVCRSLPDVEARLDLRQPGGFAVADVVCSKRIRAGCPWPRALHRGELELHAERCSGGAEVLVEKHAGEPPADFAARAVPYRKRDVRQRDRHFREAWRPELTDPYRGAAVRQVGEYETAADLRLLVPERRRTVKRPEEIELDCGP